MNTTDRLILMGQVIAHAKHKGKVLTEPVLSTMRRWERRAQAERIPEQRIDDLITHGRAIYDYKEAHGHEYSRTTKYLI